MNIVHTVESYLPSRHGMAEVVRQLSERLVARGHRVIVATSKHPGRVSNTINGVEIVDFSVWGKEVLGIWGESARYQAFIKSCGADVVVNFAAQQWATDLILPLLAHLSCKKVIVPTGFSALGDRRFETYFKGLANQMKLYDACVYLSNTYRDARWAREQGLTNGVLIPNGAAAEEFEREAERGWRARHGIPEDETLILHVAGYLSDAKGQIDAIRIVDKAKLVNARVLIVCPEFKKSGWRSLGWRSLGRSAHALMRWRIEDVVPPRLAITLKKRFRSAELAPIQCLNLSRADTIQAFLAADLLLFPSRVECSPLVLFEAAASRTPFLATPAGNAAEICEWLGNGMILPSERIDDAQQSVRAIISESARMLRSVVKDQKLRKAMAECGYHQWRNGFTWDQITDEYEKLYTGLVGQTA